MTADQLEKEILKLPRSERAELAQRLLVSLDDRDPTIEAAWNEEIKRRLAEVEAGLVDTIPAEDVLAEARALLEG